MTAGERFQIDGAKLRKAIAQRGMTFADVDRAMGHGSAYTSKIVSQGYYTKPARIMYEKLFGISYEDIKPDTQEEPEQTAEPVGGGTALDMEGLYKTIYGAVYEAVKRAWEND